jgi:hypothetical protein
VRLDVMETEAEKSKRENPGGEKVLSDLGGLKSGLPFYAVLDENGKKLADANALPGGKNIGYPATPEEIAAFEEILKKAAPQMPATDRDRIVAHLKKVTPRRG